MKPAEQASSSYVNTVIYIKHQTVTVTDLERRTLSDEHHRAPSSERGCLRAPCRESSQVSAHYAACARLPSGHEV